MEIGNMTLNEAMKDCSEVIQQNTECRECMNEHAQLLIWLEELKELREFKRRVVKAVMKVD